jgi:hypothetical protein
VAVTKGPNGLPLPRSLASVGAIRRELVALYRQTKGGQVDPQTAGRLTHQLSVLVGIMRDHDLEVRIATLEERLELPPARPNGGQYHARP